MRYIWQHIKIIIDTYDGSMPLAQFLKNYCKQHPKLGSRDRRMLSDMAYSWYRCIKGIGAEAGEDMESRMKACLLLCGNEQILKMLYGAQEYESVTFDAGKLFPYAIDVSAGISKEEWLRSLLVQPSLFIRVRKNRTQIIELLDEHNVAHKFVTNNSLALPNGAKIDAFLPADSYVVQDASSQLTGNYFHPKKNEQWYDCCSGAGGKSLLLKDAEPTVELTVTDVRDTILHNLKERFKSYKHKPPTAFVTNVTNKQALAKTLAGLVFDNIICDAPCSGSGTWARTPEQLYFFKQDSIQKYTDLQKSIATNVADYLKPGGKLFYITCSIFQAENEEVVEDVVKARGLKLLESKLINGIANKADSMFIAVLQK